MRDRVVLFSLAALALGVAIVLASSLEVPSSTLDIRISAGGDDVELHANGLLHPEFSFLEMSEGHTAVLRFDGVPIPRGSTILEAWIQFTARRADDGPADYRIRAATLADAPPLVDPAQVAALPTGAASVAWSPPPWMAPGDADAAQRTPDLSALLQPIVSNLNWNPDNAIAVVLTGTGRRVADTYDGNPTGAALLHIEYTEAEDSLRSAATTVTTTIPAPITTTSAAGPPVPTTTDATAPTGGTTTTGAALVATSTTSPPPSDGDRVRFAVVGDYGVTGSSADDVARLIDGFGVNWIATVGDNTQTNNPLDELIGSRYADYIGDYQGAYGPGSDVNRFFPTLGNHDYTDGEGIEAYYDYFTLPGDGFTSSSGTERYYDFVWGPVHFFALDGYVDTGVQRDWLQRALADSTTPWQVVTVHFPPHTSSAENGPSPWLQWPYGAWGADVVLSGHDHVYERILHDDGAGPIPYVVVGLGGAEIHDFGAPIAGSESRYNDDHGALVVDACSTGMIFTFHSVTDGAIDEFTLGDGCRSTPAEPAGRILAAGPSETIRFATIGDYGVPDSAADDVADLIRHLEADLVLTTGDNTQTNNPLDELIGSRYADYIGDYQGAYGPGSDVNRFFPTLGNHDYTDGEGIEAYYDYFTLPGDGFTSSSGTERYYDFVWGPVHFFALDAFVDTGVQRQWLSEQLPRSTSAWQVVYFHFPPYTSSANSGPSDWMQWDFEAWGADAVLSGNDQTYERLELDIDGDGTTIPYIVNGLGGGAIHGIYPPAAGSVVQYNGGNGALLAEACASGITFTFYSVTDGPIDSRTVGLPCPPQA